MVCSECNGTGMVPVEEWNASHAARQPNYRRRAKRCLDCNGTGTIKR